MRISVDISREGQTTAITGYPHRYTRQAQAITVTGYPHRYARSLTTQRVLNFTHTITKKVFVDRAGDILYDGERVKQGIVIAFTRQVSQGYERLPATHTVSLLQVSRLESKVNLNAHITKSIESQVMIARYLRHNNPQLERLLKSHPLLMKEIRDYKQVLADLATVYGANAEYVINKLDEYIRLAFQNGIDIIDFGLFRLEKIDDEIKLILLNT